MPFPWAAAYIQRFVKRWGLGQLSGKAQAPSLSWDHVKEHASSGLPVGSAEVSMRLYCSSTLAFDQSCFPYCLTGAVLEGSPQQACMQISVSDPFPGEASL